MRTMWLATVLLAACGGAPKRGGGGGDKDFVCNGRRAEYMQSGGMMYPEQGVRMKCDGNVPLVEEYYTNADGSEKKRAARVTASAWESSWNDFENAGWRRITDCDNPAAVEKDPLYTFEIADEDKTVSFRCQGSELPFPHDTILVALDKAKGELPVEEQSE